jgi:Flp pilus assembly protein TadG
VPFPARTRRQLSRTAATAKATDTGQSMVEFALILMPLFLILLGIIQFGFIFNTYIAMTNATRDAARQGTVYKYRQDCSPDQNDTLRNEAVRVSLIAAMDPLSITTPRFATTAPTGAGCARSGGWTHSGNTFTDGDLTITYLVPAGTDTATRTGQQLTVQAVYHLDLIVPLIASLLPRDAGNRLAIGGMVTMAIE